MLAATLQNGKMKKFAQFGSGATTPGGIPSLVYILWARATETEMAPMAARDKSQMPRPNGFVRLPKVVTTWGDLLKERSNVVNWFCGLAKLFQQP